MYVQPYRLRAIHEERRASAQPVFATTSQRPAFKKKQTFCLSHIIKLFTAVRRSRTKHTSLPVGQSPAVYDRKESGLRWRAGRARRGTHTAHPDLFTLTPAFAGSSAAVQSWRHQPGGTSTASFCPGLSTIPKKPIATESSVVVVSCLGASWMSTPTRGPTRKNERQYLGVELPRSDSPASPNQLCCSSLITLCSSRHC